MIRGAFALPFVAALALAGGAVAQSPRRAPVDASKQARAEQDYQLQVVSKLLSSRFNVKAQPRESVIEVQIVIARNGRLLDAKIGRSSGVAALDQAVLDALRKYSPYAPLPPEIPGMNAMFNMPIVVKAEGR